MLNKISSAMLSVFVSGFCVAEPLSNTAGWEFTLNLNAGYTHSQSQLNTDDDNKITNDLSNSGQSTSSAIVFPLGRVQYTLADLNTQFFLGNSRDQVSTAQFQYEIGATHQFTDNSKLTLAIFPKLSLFNETWKDPFLVGAKREVTDQDVGGGRIALENVLGSPFTLKYAIADSQVDDEQSGNSQLTNVSEINSVKRDSIFQRVEIETMFPISKGMFLKPTLQYTNRNAEGDANSYDQYTVQLGLLVFRPQYSVITTINTGVRYYQEENPIFDEKQNSQQFGILSLYSYKQPFNWKNWSWTLMAGYNAENSDINFYDTKGLILSTGMMFQY
jgi:hypothetical protein